MDAGEDGRSISEGGWGDGNPPGTPLSSILSDCVTGELRGSRNHRFGFVLVPLSAAGGDADAELRVKVRLEECIYLIYDRTLLNRIQPVMDCDI